MRRVMIVLALLSTLLIDPAQAGTASVTLSNVAIQVISLDPSDPNSGYATFDGIGTYGASWAQTFASPDNYQTSTYQFIYTYLGTSVPEIQSTGSGVLATASLVGGDIFASSGGPGGSASARGDGQGAVVSGDAGIFYSSFTLAAHTRLVITADTSDVDASAQPGDDVSAWAGMYIIDLESSKQYRAASFAYVFSSPNNCCSSGRNIEPHLMLAYDNDTSAPKRGLLDIDANASVTSPVPEPSMAGLFLSGLAFLMFLNPAGRQRLEGTTLRLTRNTDSSKPLRSC